MPSKFFCASPYYMSSHFSVLLITVTIFSHLPPPFLPSSIACITLIFSFLYNKHAYHFSCRFCSRIRYPLICELKHSSHHYHTGRIPHHVSFALFQSCRCYQRRQCTLCIEIEIEVKTNTICRSSREQFPQHPDGPHLCRGPWVPPLPVMSLQKERFRVL
jgi:hypothetical protein